MVAEAKNGSLLAFNDLVVRFQDMVYAVACSRLGDPDQARDVSQAAFMEAYLRLNSLREDAAFPGWVKTITVNKCHRLLKKHAVPAVDLGEAREVPSPNPNPLEVLESKEAKQQVWQLLRELGESDREILTLYYLQDRSVGQVSSFLDVPATTVKKRLYTARKRLRKRMVNMIEKNLRSERASSNSEFSEETMQMISQICETRLTERFSGDEKAARVRWDEESAQLATSAGLRYWGVCRHFVEFMEEQNIPFSPGRGAIPCSLIAYLIGASGINPLEFGLPTKPFPDPAGTYLHFEVCLNRADEVVGELKKTWKGRIAWYASFPGASPAEKRWAFLILPDDSDAFDNLGNGESGLPVIDKNDYDRLLAQGAIGFWINGSRTVTDIHTACQSLGWGAREFLEKCVVNRNDSKAMGVFSTGALNKSLDLMNWEYIAKQHILERTPATRFEDIVATVALCAARARGREDKVTRFIAGDQADSNADSAILTETLEETRGILIYQEQLQEILDAIGGRNAVKVDALIEAIEKDDQTALESIHKEYERSASEKGIDTREIQLIWQRLSSQRSLFQKGAAVGNAIAYLQAAYLKAHHPDVFDPAV